MKKTLFLSIIAMLFLFSCKRDHSASNGPKGKKYPVTFNITNFGQHQTNFAIRHGANHLADTVSTPASGADILYYAAYDNFGTPAHNFVLKQDSSMAGFGTITDSLLAGTYEITLVAGKKGLQYIGGANISNAGFTYGSTKWLDTFWDDFTITVGSSGISQDVTLKRVVGKLELNITDAIPANADSLVINVNPETINMWANSGTPMGPPSGTVTYSEKIPTGAIGTTNFTMDRLIGNNQAPFTATITCKDASNAVIGSATVSNVTVQPNMTTVLSGNLFGAPSGNSQTFNVKIDTAWSSTVNTGTFGVNRNGSLHLQKTKF